MDCRECSFYIDAVIDGEISQEDKAFFLAHLDKCEKCKKEYDDALIMKRRFDNFVEKSETSLADSVVAKIRKETSPTRKTPFIVRHIGLAASLVFILALTIYINFGKNDSNMNISEEDATVTDSVTGDVFDVKNSAVLGSDESFVKTETFLESSIKESLPEASEDNCFYYSDQTPVPSPSAPEAEAEEVLESEVMTIYIGENIEKVLPLLSEFEIIKVGENYVEVNSYDYEAIKKIIEENGL